MEQLGGMGRCSWALIKVYDSLLAPFLTPAAPEDYDGGGAKGRARFSLTEEGLAQGTHPTDCKLSPLCCFFFVGNFGCISILC